MVKWWWLICSASSAAASSPSSWCKKRSVAFAHFLDRLILKLPVIGQIMHNSAIARFARTLAVTFKAGVPLVEALDTVAGATGNIVYEKAVLRIRDDVVGGLPGQHGDEAGQPVPAHGGADDRDRRRGRRARHHAVQGGRVLRAGGQQRGRRAGQPARAVDHGHPRRDRRLHGRSPCTCRSSSSPRSSDADDSNGIPRPEPRPRLSRSRPASGCWSAASSTW